MSGIERIAKERQRQLEQEGWTPERDDRYLHGDLASAAHCYAQYAGWQSHGHANFPTPAERPVEWPWVSEWWKPSEDPIRNLEKAGALIAAEIDRLERVRARNT